jgi:predicted ester cyclase
MFANDGIAHGLSDDSANPMRGPSEFSPFHTQFREAFPNTDVVVKDQLAEGDLVATRCSVRGKHTGDSLGFAATGSPVEFTGITITRIKDGKIVEAWNNFDFMKMYRQLGAI